MSWSTILQVSDAPIDEDCYLTQGDFYEHWFGEQIADSFQDVDVWDMEQEIESSLKTVPGITYDAKERAFTVTDRKAYLETIYESFIRNIEMLHVTKEQFLSGNGADGEPLRYHINSLNRVWNYKFGLYFYCEDSKGYGSEMSTKSEFMLAAPEGSKWYVGGAVLYHF